MDYLRIIKIKISDSCGTPMLKHKCQKANVKERKFITNLNIQNNNLCVIRISEYSKKLRHR